MNTQLKLKAADENLKAAETEYRDLLAGETKMTPEFKLQLDEKRNAITALRAEVERFTELVEIDKRSAKVVPVNMGVQDGENKEIVKNFRMIDILQAGRSERATGFIKEMHEEGVKEMQSQGLSVGEGIVIPTKALRSQKQIEARASQIAGTNNVGGYLVETSVDGGVIEFLGNRLVLPGLGAMTLDNLVGNLNMPTGTTGLTTTWATEVATSTETNETFGVVSYSPNRLAGFTNISKQLIAQGNSSISTYLSNEIKRAFARAWEAAAIHGNGSGIAGITGTAGIGSVVGGTNGLAPTWAHIVDLYKQVAIDNGDVTSYLTNAAVVGKLQTVSKQASGVEGNFILNDAKGPLNGLPLAVTNNVSSTLDKGTSTGVCSAIIAGNFSDLGLASWGGIEIFFDPYTQAKAGMTVMHVNGYVDANVHRAVSFAAMLDALTA